METTVSHRSCTVIFCLFIGLKIWKHLGRCRSPTVDWLEDDSNDKKKRSLIGRTCPSRWLIKHVVCQCINRTHWDKYAISSRHWSTVFTHFFHSLPFAHYRASRRERDNLRFIKFNFLNIRYKKIATYVKEMTDRKFQF